MRTSAILMGKTGVGKSTLINAVLRKQVAKEGVGLSTTKGIHKYEGDVASGKFHMCLYDTEGFELEKLKRNDCLSEIKMIIRNCLKQKNDVIHTVWYCINSNCSRIEDEEIKIISELITEFNLSIVIVLTQAIDNKKNIILKEQICNDKVLSELIENGKIIGILSVVAKSYAVTETIEVPSKGVIELINLTADKTKTSWINVHMKQLDIMEEKASSYASKYIGATVVTGFSPIPFSDTAVLIPIQITMLVNINQIFEMQVKENILKDISSMVLKVGGAALAGRTIVSGVIKFIPGIGTIAGGVLSAGTAGAITTVLATAYIQELKARKIQEFYNVVDSEREFSEKLLMKVKENF